MKGVDVIFNTAAMKQVPSCEYNPEEPIKTNIIGAMNILDCAIDEKVNVCMHVSTDKAVYPINIYGATKLVAEKLFLHGNVYNAGRTKFSCCRYGNVLGSRGSIIPLFKQQAESESPITITHADMTRFWIKLQDVARFIIEAAQCTNGAEIFVPQMPSMKIMDLANVIAPLCVKQITGIRQGEKLHECLITEEESVYAEVHPSKYIIRPLADPVTPNRFSYTSENNKTFLNETDLKKLIDGGLYI
jgi:FlaA1/EpsC-like NDP-sugar epimerase